MRVKLKKSPIGSSSAVRSTLKSLKLNKINSESDIDEKNASLVGMCLKVAHLIEVVGDDKLVLSNNLLVSANKNILKSKKSTSQQSGVKIDSKKIEKEIPKKINSNKEIKVKTETTKKKVEGKKDE